MYKRCLFIFSFIVCIFMQNQVDAFDLGFQFSGVELSYGAYDVMASADLNIFYLEYLSIKPNFRYNVFSTTFHWGTFAEYYPLSHFDSGFWIFNDRQINPYVMLGFKVPINFSVISFQPGLGFQVPLNNELYLGFRIYGDYLVSKVNYFSTMWDFSIEYKF